jgi:lipoprotein-anchoring transpeptidase ErfK/SrfK
MMKRLSKRRLARLVLAVAAVFAVLAGLALTPARAGVVVQIDKSSQRMAVSVDGAMRYSWPVSTGRSGYGTPSGVFQPTMMARRWFSRKYYNSPMPHAIFFYHGFAIHGTYDLARLGGPASHGCVRLHPSNAATLFALVARQRGNTRIVISN